MVSLPAIGTVPNTELAREAGLEARRGVVVNEYLQTSDPDIFAMGELAEFNQNLYGITAAAEQQADVIARYLNGDLLNFYKGTLSMNILKMEGRISVHSEWLKSLWTKSMSMKK
jgi:ferredoxin-nitrate reductase